jgi:predicted Zn-dependent peptidase
MEADFVIGLQSNEDRASEVGSLEIDTGDYTNIYGYADRIQAVTADDVMRVANEYMTDLHRTVINLIPGQPETPADAGTAR